MNRTYSNDLSEGSVLKKLIMFAIPMILATFLQSVYSIVDMIVTGQYCGASGLSGVSVGGNIMTMISFIAMGLSTGGNIVIGQFYGAKDTKNRKESTATTMGFMLLFGILLAISLFLMARPIMILMKAPAIEEAVTYFRISALGCIFIFGFNALCSIIRAVGDSKTPLYIILVAAVANVGLDLLLIAVFKIGVAGAAVATVTSQFVSFLIALIYTLKHSDFFGFTIQSIKIYKVKLKLILKIGIPSALVFSINGFTHLFNTSLINGYGVAVSAGSGSALKISDLCIGFVTAMMNASSTMVAQSIGAGNYERVKKILHTNIIIDLILAIFLMAFMFFGARFAVSLFNRETEVIEAGVFYLRLIAPQALTYVFFTSLHAVATGAGDAKWVMWNSIFGMAIPRVLLTIVLNHFIGLGGVALSCVFAPLCAIPVGVYYYKTNRWRHQMSSNSIHADLAAE